MLKCLTRLTAAARRLPPLLVDALLALGLLAGTAASGHSAWSDVGRHAQDLRGLLLSAGVMLPLALRRVRPIAVLAVTCVMYGLYLAAGYMTSLNYYGPLLAFATVAMLHRTRVAAYAWLPVAALMFGGSMTSPGFPLLASIAQAVLAPLLAWTFGASIRGLSMRNRRLAELTRRLEQAQLHVAERAALEERVRIARELHDAAAHHMSVIGVQAELAHYVFDSDPAQAHASLGVIAQASRDALAEMRDLLTVLRPPTASEAAAATRPDPDEFAFEFPAEPGLFAAEPGLDRLGRLVERVRAAGVEVKVEFVGRRRLLPAATDACAYRIVQEALTNVAKHAPRTRACVIIGYGSRNVEITVANSMPAGRVPAGAHGSAGAAVRTRNGIGDGTADGTENAGEKAAENAAGRGVGHGLIGMRERVARCGGEIDTGPLADGGYRVAAVLPLA